MAIYITGDTHGSHDIKKLSSGRFDASGLTKDDYLIVCGDFERVARFCETFGLTAQDTVVVLGDVGLNYHGGRTDRLHKQQLASLESTIFCVHGNHEKRPQHILTYHETVWHGGRVLAEDACPNVLFPIDGEVFDLDGKTAVVIGGAYSIDKHVRLARGWKWFADEQLDDVVKARVEAALEARGWKVDAVLTHTCPLKYLPVETFISGIDQSKVDQSTEAWLDGIEDRLDCKRWLCGHFHTDKRVDRMRFMFEDWEEL